MNTLLKRARETLAGCLFNNSNAYAAPLWICCRCDEYNAEDRKRCRDCGHERCPERPTDKEAVQP
jgi:hypothetical protein